jgi:signal recognition particle subunit SRP54
VFENLTQRLSKTLTQLRGRGRLTEASIKDALREVRMALLEADVALPVVRDFVERVRERAVGQDVLESLSPGQEVIRIVRDELTALMGEANEALDLRVAPPSCDVHRPAAIKQLETLAGEVGAFFFPSDPSQDPVAIAEAAIAEGRRQFHDVVILDTAGRLHIDEEMMAEVRRVHAAASPVETLFVVDSMSGQDAANVARAFDEALPLSGVILTKADGDARGGAALSVRHVTGKPLKFIGVGEKTDALQAFHPERVASRILGMGDVLSLIEEAEQKVDRDKAEKLVKKLKKGKGFDLEDFSEQLEQMREMGGMAALLDKLPGGAALPPGASARMGDQELKRMHAIIGSMTPQERLHPAIIKGSRKRRIAAGSGNQVQDVNRLLKQFAQMQKMMKRMKKKGGLARLMQGMKGGMPPGMPG